MSTCPKRRQSLRRRLLAAAALAGILSLSAATASADDYDPKSSGHPLRIAAYIVHPIGVILDYLILRPAHWIGSHEPMKTLFGHK